MSKAPVVPGAYTAAMPANTPPPPIDFASLSRETGVPVDVLRTFAHISDPLNEALFSKERLHQLLLDDDTPRGGEAW